VRWIPLVILMYVTVILQTTVGQMLSFVCPLGRVAPDLLAIVAVYLALRGVRLSDVLIAAWALGMGVDLTMGGGPGGAGVVGPMALAYVIAAGLIYKLRDAVYGENFLTQAVLALVFCLLAHVLWLVGQSVLAWSTQGLGGMLAQAFGSALYTAVAAPMAMALLKRVRGLIFQPMGRRERRTREPIGSL
jgi:cell shape-determining protein MreD